MVFSAINSWTAALSPRFGELQFYRLVVSCFTDPIYLAMASTPWLFWWHGGCVKMRIRNGCIFKGFSPNLTAIYAGY